MSHDVDAATPSPANRVTEARGQGSFLSIGPILSSHFITSAVREQATQKQIEYNLNKKLMQLRNMLI